MTTLLPHDPKWLKDVLHLLPIRAQFVLSGNIRDLVLLGDPPSHMSLQAALWHILEPLGYAGMLIWDPVDGLQPYPRDARRLTVLTEVSGEDFSQPRRMLGLDSLASCLRSICVPQAPSGQVGSRIALVIDFASRLRGDQQLPDDARELFVAAEKAALEARPLPAGPAGELFNPVFWLANRASDIPYWFTIDNERVRGIPIPLPDGDTRHRFALGLHEELAPESRDLDREPFAKLLAGMTHNMSLNALWDIAALAGRMKTRATDIDDAVQSYRVGDMGETSPWRGELLRQRILGAENPDTEICLEKTIRGQPKAVNKVLDILKRTSVGLTGAQSPGSASRPRGILFFVGPTGVGKTESPRVLRRLLSLRRWSHDEQETYPEVFP